MKRIICILLIACLIPACSFAYDESMIPEPIKEESLYLSARTENSEYTLTGIRFDLDDENMPVIIIKEKQKNISERSIDLNNNLWIFNHDPYAISGSLLQGGASHYKKEYLGIEIQKNKKGKIRYVNIKPDEIAPGEEFEWESIYCIDNFADPVYMYYMTKENSTDRKWMYETIVVIPDKGSVTLLKVK